MDFCIKDGCDYPEEIKELFTEYTDALCEASPEFRGYLAIQDYDEEIKHLTKKYGRPDGRLYIVFSGNIPIASAALRKLDSETAEIKRLYVREKYRKSGLGEKLTKLVMEEAKKIGYKSILLDTLPFLETAIRLYKKLGFYEIPCYNNNPIENSVYMRFDF